MQWVENSAIGMKLCRPQVCYLDASTDHWRVHGKCTVHVLQRAVRVVEDLLKDNAAFSTLLTNIGSLQKSTLWGEIMSEYGLSLPAPRK